MNRLRLMKKTMCAVLVLLLMAQAIPLTGGKAEADAAPSVTVRKVVTAYKQSFALDSDGRLWAWGAYDNFIFGGISAPKVMEVPFEGTRIKDIASGYNFLIALLEDGTVWIRGEGVKSKQFEELPGLESIASIDTTAYYAYGLGADGKLWQWSGYSPTYGMYEPPQARTDVQDIAQVTGGYVVKKDGTVWSLGFGSEEPLTQVQGLTDVERIAVGNIDQTGYALRKDGTVWGWGNRKLDKMNLASLQTDYKRFFEAVPIEGLEHVKAIAAGHHHFLALKEDGTVWAWGQNESGQLGNGTTANSGVPVQVKGLRNVASISSGYQVDHSFAILADQTVWSWGGNSERETGTQEEAKAVTVPRQVKFTPVAGKGDEKFTITQVGQGAIRVETVDSNDQGLIIAATKTQLLVSTNYGETWSKKPHPVKDSFYTVKHAGSNFYYWTYNTKKPQLLTSRDGTKWSSIALEGPDGALTVRNIMLLNKQYVLLASYDGQGKTYIFTSGDGSSWKQTGILPVDNIYEVAWNGKRYTAIGGGYLYYGAAKSRNQFVVIPSEKRAGELIIYTSDNLKQWTQQSGSVKSLNYTFTINGKPSNNYYVSMAEPVSSGTITLMDAYGNILTSKDGISFTQRPAASVFKSMYGHGPILSNGKQYLVYISRWRDEGAVLTSTDKVTWSERKIANIPLAMTVLKSGKKFIGFGDGGLIAVSSDGLNWKIKQGPAPTQFTNQIIKANGRYVAVGSEFLYSVPGILTSKDGSSWTQVLKSERNQSGYQDDIQSVDWNGKLFAAVGGAYTYTSSNGMEWSKRSSVQGMNLQKVIWTGKTFVALGQSLDQKQYALYTSANGVNWTASYRTSNPILDIAAHNGTVVAVGAKKNQAMAMSSKDLTNWKEVFFTLGKDNKSWNVMMKGSFYGYAGESTFTSVQWVNGQFLIASDKIYGSKDGVKWSAMTGTYDEYVQGSPKWTSNGRILWTGQDYYYYKNNVIGVSTDLKQWEFYEFNELSGLKHMIWNGTDLLGSGEDGLLARIKPKKK